MLEHTDAIVIGSGFGGAVAACRMAQAGLKVTVLERGRRYPPGAFPRNLAKPVELLWESGVSHGIYDIRPVQQMQVVQGAGWGGGSLVYANVHLRPPPEVFQEGWPKGYSREMLDPYFDLVAYMLDINPITKAPGELPLKTRRMQEVAAKLDRRELCYPNLAVNFAPPGEKVKNKFGAEQHGCTHCGECVIGCNIHAKNTLDLNYLHIAEKLGARARPGCEAQVITPQQGGDGGYVVKYIEYRDDGSSSQREIAAKYVFVCAGSVNSTELLLRCRDQHKTLPKLNSRLGDRYSGNGDLLVFAVETKEPFDASKGPTITSGLVYDRRSGGQRIWFILEEGGFPKDFAPLVSLVTQPKKFGALLLKREVTDAIQHLLSKGNGATDDRYSNLAIFLAMGVDRADGRIMLNAVQDLCVRWDLPNNLPLYDAEQQLATDVARALGGNVAFEPFWQKLHIPVTVHNLGGCVMGDERGADVTDGFGEVYHYPNLFVLDGALLPAATGVNPSHTIAAVAEHNIEAFIRRIKKNESWTAPENAEAKPIVDPVTALYPLPHGETPPSATPVLGLAFKQHMEGSLQDKGDKLRVTLSLEMIIGHLNAFLANSEHAAGARGHVRVEGHTQGDVEVVGGSFNLFNAEDAPGKRHVAYLLPFHGGPALDEPYLLEGRNELFTGETNADFWSAATLVELTLRKGHDREGPVIAKGLVKMGVLDLIRMAGSVRLVGTADTQSKLETLTRFGALLFGELWNDNIARRLQRLWRSMLGHSSDQSSVRPAAGADAAIVKCLDEAAVKVGGTGLTLFTGSYVNLVLVAESRDGTVALVAGSYTQNFPYDGTDPWDNCLLRIGDEAYTFTSRKQGESLQMDFELDADRSEGKIRFKGEMLRARDQNEVSIELEIPVMLSRLPTRRLGEDYNFLEVDGSIGMRWTPFALRGEVGHLRAGGHELNLTAVSGACESGVLTNVRAQDFAIQYDYVCVARSGDDGYAMIDFTAHALYPDGPLGRTLDFYLTRSASAVLTIERGQARDGNAHRVYSPPQDDSTVTLFENQVDLGPAVLRRQMIKTTDGDGKPLYGLREIFEAKPPERPTFHLNRVQVNVFLFLLIVLDVVLSTWALFFPERWFHDFYNLPYTDPGSMLARTGAVWVAFTLLQAIALFRWQKQPYWLPLIAGVRLTELFSDWTVLALADQVTLFSRIGLFIAPPANLIFGLLLISTYHRAKKGEILEGSFFAKPWS